jgi:pyrroloquinoline quinone (PQQ) biosynthesis protein C
MNTRFNSFNIQIQEEFEKYESRSAIFFDYLKEQSKVGFTKEQFEVYRDNYFSRTYQTIICVAKVVISAALNEDYITLNSAGKNCFEETGSGIKGKTHPELLLYSHNKHAATVFGLGNISFTDSLKSPNVLDATKTFTKTQLSLYSSLNHIEVLAANYAQEEAATKMLRTFMTCFFEPYRHLYPESEYEDVTEYFTCHLNGLEERHADEAKFCLLQQCNTSNDEEMALASISKMLKAQSDMWVGLKKGFTDSTNSTINEIVYEQ